MELGLSLGLSRLGGGGPAAYAAYTTTGSKAVDNGWYEGYTRAGGWETFKTTSGLITVTTASVSDPLKLYGPYALAPTGTVGSAMTFGQIWNSRATANTYGGISVHQGIRKTSDSQGADVFNTHQGWTTDGTYYYTIDTDRITKRAKDASWTTVVENATPFVGMTGSPTHLADGCYYNGYLLIPAEKYNSKSESGGSDAQYQQIGVFRASDLTLVSTYDMTGYPTWELASICVDGSQLVGCDYANPAVLHRLDLAKVLSGTPGAVLSDIAIEGGWRDSQGITQRSGRYYISCARRPATSGVSVVVRDTNGKVLDEYLCGEFAVGEQQGLDFDGTSLGFFRSTASLSKVYFFSLPTDPTLTQSGWLAAKDRFQHFPKLAPATEFTIFEQLVPTTLFDFNTIFDNDGSDNDYEGWNPADGSVRGRANSASSATYTGPITAGSVLTYSFAYNQSTGARALYVNNADRVVTADTAKAFPTSAAFGIGCRSTNSLSDSRFRLFYLFNRALTLAEKQALEADPFSVWTPTNALSAADKLRVQSS